MRFIFLKATVSSERVFLLLNVTSLVYFSVSSVSPLPHIQGSDTEFFSTPLHNGCMGYKLLECE